MSKIEWEHTIVERAFCQQLDRIGWQWIESDPDLPETTERSSSREVLLKGRLATALRKLNLRNGQPWLDEARITRAIRDLEQAAGHRLMETSSQPRSCCSRARLPKGFRTGFRPAAAGEVY